MKWGSSTVGRVSAAVAPVAPPAAAAQGASNPPRPARCPPAVGLPIDQSDSMSGRFGEVREATRNVVDALDDKPSCVTIIGFGTVARTARSDVDVSDDDAGRGLEDDVDVLDSGEGTGGATNRDAALTAAGSHDLSRNLPCACGPASSELIPASTASTSSTTTRA